MEISLRPLFARVDSINRQILEKQNRIARDPERTAITRHMSAHEAVKEMDGLKRITLCRSALEAIDRRGWCVHY